jgi:hypothetical protein
MIKKIETQENRDRKAKRNKIIISVAMVVLIGLSSLGYAIMSNNGNSSSNDSIVKYAGLQFVKSNDLWATIISGKTFYFNYLPTELTNVSISGNYSFNDYFQNTVYVINVNSGGSGLLNAIDAAALRLQEACLAGMDCSNADLPIKKCSDNLIVFSDSNSSSTTVTKSQNCTFISGDFFKGSDKLLYKLLNIE